MWKKNFKLCLKDCIFRRYYLLDELTFKIQSAEDYLALILSFFYRCAEVEALSFLRYATMNNFPTPNLDIGNL